MKSPFPYFGGKSKAASLVWERFGNPKNYVEPFAGSLAVLLARPDEPRIETVNDLDGLLANFWRAVSIDAEAVAMHADHPVNENDLHARHSWLVSHREEITRQLEGDPDWFDSRAAGWWVWGISCWIGSGWCSGRGPWTVVEDEDGERRLLKSGKSSGLKNGVKRQRPHLGNAGQGVKRQLPHLSNTGQGVNRNGDGRGLYAYFEALQDRLRNVRVVSGDWTRVLRPSVTTKLGLTAVLLDPPYADTAGRDPNLYAKDSESVAHQVREWAIANGDNPLLRIALCGYEGEHEMPDSWEVVAWKTGGGYNCQSRDASRIGVNRKKERIWFSPHCLRASEFRPQGT